MCGCVPGKVAEPEARNVVSKTSTIGATVASTEDSKRLQNFCELEEVLAVFPEADDSECQSKTKLTDLVPERNDDSEYGPEVDSEDASNNVLESVLNDLSDDADDISNLPAHLLSDIPVHRLRSAPGITTPEMEGKMREILKYHRCIFLGDVNAEPAPASGVVCDLDLGDAKPITQRSRQITPRYSVKGYELSKKILETGLIEHSE
ncbi:hypothetical protein PHMEG_00018864 [Phytophthora megakarya]|uniref:Reverse transcriptase n=1 Tax=Phytophthora megakarya TaxID=4795 RepID=A0A225VUS5_9STRA|nr:hypothetical protein PHMEG_00018864 [Phytophthora megakarya]